MEDKILFVSDHESFIIRSIMRTVGEEGGNCIFSLLNSESIRKVRHEIESTVYFYVDDMASIEEKELHFLNDFCTNNGFILNIIAYEKDAVKLKDEYFAEKDPGIYLRPVNTKELAAWKRHGIHLKITTKNIF